jgi:hypothetical protein
MNTEIIRILDFDLDFFLTDIPFRTRLFGKKRLKAVGGWYQPWTETKLVNFLESNCGLNKKNKIRGKYFIYHHLVWRLNKGFTMINFLQDLVNFLGPNKRFRILVV